MALDDAQNSDVVFGQPSGAAALAPAKKDDTVKLTPKPTAPEPTLKPDDPNSAALGAQAAAVHEDTAKKIGSLDAERMQLTPPQLTKPEKFEPKKESSIQEWARVAILFASLGGHGSRQALTSSLNASAAALEGLKKGDKEEYDRQFKKWQVDTENAHRLIEFQNDAYKTALGNITNREEAARIVGTEKAAAITAKINALAVAQQDPIMAKQPNLEAMAELAQHREDDARRLKEKQIDASKGGQIIYNRNRADEDIKAFNESDEGKAASDVEKAEHALKVMERYGLVDKGKGGQQLPPLTSAQKEAQKARWKDFTDAPFNPNSRVSTQPGRREAWDEFHEENKSWYRPEKFAEIQSAVKSIAPGGKDGQKLQSLGTAAQHTLVMEDAAKKLPQVTDQPTANRIVNAAGTALGYPAATDFNFVKQIYVQELAKAVAGASGGSARERENYEKSLADQLSKAQMFGDAEHPGIFERANQLLRGRYEVMKDTYAETLPEPTLKEHFTPKLDQIFKVGSGEEKPIAPRSYGEARKLPIGSTIMLEGEPHKITGEEDWYKWKGR